MSVLGWILFGFITALIARVLMPARDPLGLIGTAVLGIVGALVAGWIGLAAGWYGPQSGAGFASATVGAILVLTAYYAYSGWAHVIESSKHASSRNQTRKSA